MRDIILKRARFIGKRPLIWMLIGISAGIFLAITELFFSYFIVLLLNILKITDQSPQLPLGLSLTIESATHAGILLISLGIVRSAMFILSGLSAVVSHEVFLARLKLFSMHELLLSKNAFSSLSQISSLFAEIYQKTALFFHSFALFLPLAMQATLLSIFLLKIAPQYTMIGVIYASLSGFIVYIIHNKISDVTNDLPFKIEGLYKTVIRIIKNWFLIRVLSIETKEKVRFTNSLLDCSTKSIYSGFLSLISVNLPSVLGIILIVIFISMHVKNSYTSNAAFLSFLYLFMRLIQVLAQIVNYLGALRINYPYFKKSWQYYCECPQSIISNATKYANHISIFKDTPDFLKTSSHLPTKSLKKVLPTKLPEIIIKDLTFRYSSSSPLIIKNFSCYIAPGQQMAIVGASGSGKSTLLALLTGILQPSSGNININSLPPSDYFLKSGASIGYVGAESYLIDGTLRENITYGNKFHSTDKEIISALKDAELFHWFSPLTEGLDFQISEDGSNLSTGQKQRISIARALLRKPAILVFDEISANLDAKTEEKLAITINNLKQKSTVILASHRLGVIKYSDFVVNL